MFIANDLSLNQSLYVIKRCSYEMRSKRNFVDIEQDEIDREEFNFKFSEIDIASNFSFNVLIRKQLFHFK